MAAKEKDPRTVTLKKVRLSFTDGIYEKQATNPEEPDKKKHNFNVILEKTGPGATYFDENHAKVIAAMEAAGLKQWKKADMHVSIAEDNPKRVTYKDGKRFKNKEGKIYTGYEGNMAFSATGPSGGQKRPILRDKYKREVAEKDIQDVFYGGTYADVIVSFYGTDKGSAGIFATAELVRSHQEGERMGGGFVLSDDDLDELDDLGDPSDDGLDDDDDDDLLS